MSKRGQDLSCLPFDIGGSFVIQSHFPSIAFKMASAKSFACGGPAAVMTTFPPVSSQTTGGAAKPFCHVIDLSSNIHWNFDWLPIIGGNAARRSFRTPWEA